MLQPDREPVVAFGAVANPERQVRCRQDRVSTRSRKREGASRQRELELGGQSAVKLACVDQFHLLLHSRD
jgi:hypothetical protein